MDNNPHVTYVESDYHSGHLLGLTPPKYWTEETKIWLEPLWTAREALIASLPPINLHLINGDLVDGEGKKGSTYHLTTNVRKQERMAAENILRVRAARRVIVRGTAFHTDRDGPLEDNIGEIVDCPVYDAYRVYINGRRFHYRHVIGRSDTITGGYGHVAKQFMNDLLAAELEGYTAADVLVRSHVHYCIEAGMADSQRGWMRKAITTPAWQLKGPMESGYTRKLQSWMYHVGGLVVRTYLDGRVEFEPKIVPIRLTTPGYNDYEKETTDVGD